MYTYLPTELAKQGNRFSVDLIEGRREAEVTASELLIPKASGRYLAVIRRVFSFDLKHLMMRRSGEEQELPRNDGFILNA